MSTVKKILISSANPKDTARLRLDEEVREIDEGLKRSKHRDQFVIYQKWAVHLRDLRRAMLDNEPQIVHFCGHGEKDGLMVEDDNGNAILVSPKALSGLFELFSDQIECVLLNACYSEVQANAITKHIPYVIGMSQGIQDRTAIEFAVGFYDALGAGKSLEEAFKFGCNAIQLQNLPEHLIPILKKRQIHGKPEQRESKLNNQNSVTIDFFSIDYKSYLERLKSYVLESFRQDRYVMLTVESLDTEDADTLTVVQEALRSAFEIHVEPELKGEGKREPLEKAIENHRLVALLGDPGIGKTMSLRFITLQHIQQVLENTTQVIPIWVSLGKWVDKEMTAEEFLWHEFRELCDGKEITQNALKSLLMQGKLMILLDGLNELPQRELEKIDVSSSQLGFKEEANKRLFDPRENSLLVLARESKSRFILSCRTFEYIHLPGWREFRILPLNDEQIGDFVQRHLGYKAPHLETILEQRPGLRELMRTPFFLRSLIGLTQGDWRELPADRFQLVEFTCRAALLRETKRRSLNIQEVAKLLGEESLDLMVNGWIGSWFAASLKLNPEAKKNEQPRLLPFVDVFRCAEGAGLVVRTRENPEEVAYRYQHQLVQEALALIYLKSEHFEDAEYSEVQSLKHIGEIHAEWGKFKEAQENFLRALERCPTVGAESIRASILLNVSQVYRFWRQSKQGLQHAAAAIQLLDHMGDTIQLAETYHELGILNVRVKQSKEAEKYYRLALEVYKRLGEESKYAYEIIYGLADLYSSPNVYKIPKAMRWYQKALEIFEAQDDAFGIVRTKLEIAHAWRLWGEMGKAEELFRFYAEEFEGLQEPWLQVRSLKFWGITLRDTRRLSEALPIFEKALHLAQQHRLQAYQISILNYGLGWVTSLQGKHNRALELLDEALSLAKRQANPYYLSDTYGYGLGYVCWRAKDFQKAAEYYLLYDKSMDEEYRLHLHLYRRLYIKWAKTIGIHANASWLARSISRFFWILDSTVNKLNRPSHWFGRQLWRLSWWLHRF